MIRNATTGEEKSFPKHKTISSVSSRKPISLKAIAWMVKMVLKESPNFLKVEFNAQI